MSHVGGEWRVFVNGAWHALPHEGALTEWVRSGHIGPSTQIQHSTWPAPMPIVQVPAFQSLFGAAGPTAKPRPPMVLFVVLAMLAAGTVLVLGIAIHRAPSIDAAPAPAAAPPSPPSLNCPTGFIEAEVLDSQTGLISRRCIQPNAPLPAVVPEPPYEERMAAANGWTKIASVRDSGMGRLRFVPQRPWRLRWRVSKSSGKFGSGYVTIEVFFNGESKNSKLLKSDQEEAEFTSEIFTFSGKGQSLFVRSNHTTFVIWAEERTP